MHRTMFQKKERKVKKPSQEQSTMTDGTTLSLMYRLVAIVEKGKGDRQLILDDIYDELSKVNIAGGDSLYLLTLLNYFFDHPQSFSDDDIQKIEAKTIKNILSTKNPNFFRSHFRTNELLGYFPENRCKKIRETIFEMRENLLSEEKTPYNPLQTDI